MATAKLLSRTLKFYPTIAEFEQNYNVALQQDRVANPLPALVESTEPVAPPEVRARYVAEMREFVVNGTGPLAESLRNAVPSS